MTSCFVCGKPTLGLDGVEARLDTFMLRGENGRGVLESGHFGDCHLACLARSASGERWSHALLWHFENNLRFRLTEKRDEFSVLHCERSGQYVVLWAGGAHYTLSEPEFVEFQQGQRIARHGKQRITVNAGANFNEWFCEALRNPGGVPVAEVYRRLGVPEHVCRSLSGLMKASPQATYVATANDGFDGSVEMDYSFEASSQK